MIKVLQCVLIILSLLFVTGDEDFKQNKLEKNNYEYNIKGMNDIIDKNAVEDAFYRNKNYLKNSGGSKKINELKNDVVGLIIFINNNIKKKDQNLETKYKKKDDAYDDVVLINGKDSGRPIGRSRIVNFLKKVLGWFTGRGKLINVSVNNNQETTNTVHHHHVSGFMPQYNNTY